MSIDQATLYQRPAELLQRLIQFDTTNPPGNERECILFIRKLLEDAGIPVTLVERSPQRPNLVARLKGDGRSAPLLLYGHVDVVTTQGQTWQHPPFEGRLVDGYVWGRGALDMKGGVAMLLAAFLRAKTENANLPGDVIFTAVPDEEAGGEFGAKFLVEQHPGLFENVHYALSEFGGFNLSINGKRFYPIMIAEKQMCWMKATFHGPGGHASMPVRGGAMARLAQALQTLDQRWLPVHITPAVKLMIEAFVANMSGVYALVLRQLLNPALTDRVLKLLGERGNLFTPLLHNTISPTVLEASSKINVIPSTVSLGLDGRLVPGATVEQVQAELHALLGTDFQLEILDASPGPSAPNMGFFDSLRATLKDLDPEGIPIPYVLAAVSDARFFSRLGIQTYGFVPLQLPDDFNFTSTVHAADERVPIAALEFGSQAIFNAITRSRQ